ncbi:MAG: type II toxin-antitoxin system PemK/MazF family toxin [Thermodesulfobacteriota bacterium]|nr:type II toxin-antitoxin system PemK/MazF family toxin [Thermodesulfobacteriota bacterium]
MKSYIPQKGDFIALTFDPQAGHEQKGRRPALVVSNSFFNKKAGLAFVCPVTNTDRNVPLHVKLPDDINLTGVVMTDQMKSVDYKSRKAKFIEKAPEDVLNEVLAILDAILYD